MLLIFLSNNHQDYINRKKNQINIDDRFRFFFDVIRINLDIEIDE